MQFQSPCFCFFSFHKHIDLTVNNRSESTQDCHSVKCDTGEDAELDDDDFNESVAKQTKRFYIGGFKASVKIPKLTKYIKNRGLNVTMIWVIRQRYGQSVVIRLNVETPNSIKLTEQGFWPRGVTCRPWAKVSHEQLYNYESDLSRCLKVSIDHIYTYR